jgi:predicted PurR-regulated permease PerM
VVTVATTALIVACLYWAQAVFMPLAFATLLTFLLNPAVTWLERRLGRVASIVVVAMLVVVGVVGAGYVVLAQLAALGNELPGYKDNIKHKLADVRSMGKGGSLEKVKKTVEQAAGEADQDSGEPSRRRRSEPTPVVVEGDRSSQVVWSLPSAVGAWLEPLATAGLVVVLVVFMLLERTELRNRLLRMMGHRRLALTTKALDEAGARITRYLLMQSLVNASFGLGVGVGLYVLGMPYVLLWALLAAVLRFIPYVGPWLGALMPVAVGLAVFDGWLKPLIVVALFLGLELFTNMALETLLYASSAGVSQVALLVAVAFWAWLWGPIGLLLATPLTVCLVVLSKHVAGLEFVTILLGDAPVLSPSVSLYQRLLAGDHDEASDIVDQFLEREPPETVYDGLLLPALILARRDHDRGRLDGDDVRAVLRMANALVDDLVLQATPDEHPEPRPTVRVIGYPARDEFDELALTMLRHVLIPARVALEASSSAVLSSELIARTEATAETGPPAILCIATLPPGGVAHVRSLIKRLRRRVPGLRIVVGRWGTPDDLARERAAFRAAGADEVPATLLETRDRLRTLGQLSAPTVAEPADANV